MRRKTTKEILTESFKELTRRKPANKITVQEIADNCGFSPATFYRHFKDKYDLIAWDYATSCSAIIDGAEEGGGAWGRALVEGCAYYYEQRNYLRNLLQNTSGRDSFTRYMSELNCDLLSREVRKSVGASQELGDELSACVRIYSLGTVQFVCEWLMGGCQMPYERVAELLAEALPAPLSVLSRHI